MVWHFPTHCPQFCVYTPQPAVLHLSVDFIVQLFIVTREPPHILGENIRLSALEHLVQLFAVDVGPSWRARRHVIRVLNSCFQKKFRYIENENETKKKPHLSATSCQISFTQQARQQFNMSRVIITLHYVCKKPVEITITNSDWLPKYPNNWSWLTLLKR